MHVIDILEEIEEIEFNKNMFIMIYFSSLNVAKKNEEKN
jgi:hypothetical protein